MLHQGFSYNSLLTLFNSFHIFLIRATKNVFHCFEFFFLYLGDYLHCKNLHLYLTFLFTFEYIYHLQTACFTRYGGFLWHFKPSTSKNSDVITILTIIFGHHLYFVRTSTKGFCSSIYHWTPSPMGFRHHITLIPHITFIPKNYRVLPYETSKLIWIFMHIFQRACNVDSTLKWVVFWLQCWQHKYNVDSTYFLQHETTS